MEFGTFSAPGQVNRAPSRRVSLKADDAGNRCRAERLIPGPFAGFTFVRPGVASDYGISAIPTVILFHAGDVKQKFVGLRQKGDFVAAIEALTA